MYVPGAVCEPPDFDRCTSNMKQENAKLTAVFMQDRDCGLRTGWVKQDVGLVELVEVGVVKGGLRHCVQLLQQRHPGAMSPPRQHMAPVQGPSSDDYLLLFPRSRVKVTGVPHPQPAKSVFQPDKQYSWTDRTI